MAKTYLSPKHPVGVAPAADRNIERLSPCCLDVNPKNASMMKGRGGGAWWMIWLGMMMSVGVLLILILDILVQFRMSLADIKNIVYILATVAFPSIMVFGLSLLWPIHVWRNQRPMRFNRRTRTVQFYHRGKTYSCKWDSIRAYLNLHKGITAQGVPLADEHLNIEFIDDTGRPVTAYLMGTQKLGLRHMEGAQALWEYIRVYMEEGPEQLPAPQPWVEELAPGTLLKANNPFPIIHGRWPWLWPFEVAILFPFRVVWHLISLPTDVLYYQLAKRLNVKPFPPEMRCVCDDPGEGAEVAENEQATAVEDGSGEPGGRADAVR